MRRRNRMIYGATLAKTLVNIRCLSTPLVVHIVDRQQIFAPHSREDRGIVDEVVDPTEGAVGLCDHRCGALSGQRLSVRPADSLGLPR